MKYGKKRSYPGSNSDDKKGGNFQQRGKHGRKEMRNVTRTTRRGPRPGEVQEQDEENIMGEDSDIEDEIEQDVSSKKMGEIPTGAAYDALLVLLKSESKRAPKSKNGSSTVSEELGDKNGDEDEDEAEEEEEEEAEDEVAGAKLFESDQEESQSDFEEDLDSDDELDPFEAHFNLQSDDYLSRQETILRSNPRWPIVSKNAYDSEKYTSLFQSLPSAEAKTPSSKPQNDLESFKHIKQRVRESYLQSNSGTLTTRESMLLEPMLNYTDINYPYRSFENKQYRKLYLLHVLNHVNKTRDRVIKNNNKLRAYQESLKDKKTRKGKGEESEEEEEVEEPEFRDQGFTRPKVLILLPTRESCYELVEQLIQLSGSEQQENKGKFKKQFHNDSVPPEYKPEDFRDAFKGNNSDFFCIGVKFTRKTVKLYSSFYTSDIILASPIGLSMILENTDKKKRQYDFLSSIEVLIIDRAHQIEMQNWDHVNTVLKYVNKIPKEFHDADFSRIRMWSINDQSKLIRQNLIFSEYASPNINNFVSKSMNLQGKLKFKPSNTNDTCMMNSIGLKLKQIYHRFESNSSPMQDPDLRFKFFINSILPSLTKTTSYEDGLLIYIPSYYDYLRIKSHMMDHTKLTFGSIDEYSSQAQLSRTRTAFASGKLKVLLYTERLHYFRRFEIGGVKNLLMYGLPSNPLFYKDLARFIGKSVYKGDADLDLSFMKILYSKWDANTLERIVGSERCSVLCNSVNEMFEFR
ncbi:U3 small nucleolar RNA-associated protein 25 [[Candida] railenensis]|uniref:U3 small nucleolar RNA-associated protein 25 n=1 Tax=[Candida] railenensis TaxID=45579 RepID=A0A9P0VYU0_9ASCO|nr:U3 small nucleolar RNA-associated protein 25 [[Candida] railenensis]